MAKGLISEPETSALRAPRDWTRVLSIRMSDYLFQYHKVHPTTWVYLSSLLMLGLFFKFSRFWSVRNLDIILLILLILDAVVGINGIFSNLDLSWYATIQWLDLSTDLIIVDGIFFVNIFIAR